MSEKLEKETFILELSYEELIQVMSLLDTIKFLNIFNILYKENEDVYNSIRNKLSISQEEVFYKVRSGKKWLACCVCY